MNNAEDKLQGDYLLDGFVELCHDNKYQCERILVPIENGIGESIIKTANIINLYL